MLSASISKLNLNGKTIYVKTHWQEDENDLFHITVYDNDNNTWSGRFTHEFAERYRENVDETLEEYNKNVKDALSGNCRDFQYEFSHKHAGLNSATFGWKKQYNCNGKINLLQHGAVPLYYDDIPNKKETLIDILLAENEDLKQKINEYDMNNQLINSELEQSKGELEKFISVKTSLEMSLYSKFIQMLNSKKKRIDLLEENFKRIGARVNVTDSIIE